MKVISTVAELRSTIGDLRRQGRTIGLVPTMGALHAGHLSLIEKARTDCDIVVTSIFVNPTQFNNPEDLRTYPRTVEADCASLEKSGVDFAFIPTVEEMYPEPDTRQFNLGPVAEVMEGPMRPGHFNGVAQVVSKLFSFVNPHKAYFGEKDYQQIAVIRRMVEIEGFDIEIVACPIVREPDGLAMSSRNVRLTPDQRAIAPSIHRVLIQSLEQARGQSVAEVESFVTRAINSIDGLEVEYFTIVDSLSMQPLTQWADAKSGTAVGCVTVYCGEVRLIDNITYAL
ncbi:MAG: pantoate--beta-alanine ligase [Muribaculaceae bacterium]|nr:pantoate--beta-alanine ligase [Muribaculaceae bacterium]